MIQFTCARLQGTSRAVGSLLCDILALNVAIVMSVKQEVKKMWMEGTVTAIQTS